MVNIGNSWDEILKEDFNSESYLSLRKFLIEEYKKYTVYPDMHDLFNALKYTPYEDVKVVILGQDPYYNPGQAHGLCFSVKEGVPAPKSLINIFKEIKHTVYPSFLCYGFIISHFAIIEISFSIIFYKNTCTFCYN